MATPYTLNQYPWWKYLLIGLVILWGLIFALLAGIGDPGSDSLAQELVRLLEDTAALAAKPFCRGDAGVNAGLLGEKLAENAARGAYQPELAEIMADLARRGVVDAAVKAPRADDLFIA